MRCNGFLVSLVLLLPLTSFATDAKREPAMGAPRIWTEAEKVQKRDAQRLDQVLKATTPKADKPVKAPAQTGGAPKPKTTSK